MITSIPILAVNDWSRTKKINSEIRTIRISKTIDEKEGKEKPVQDAVEAAICKIGFFAPRIPKEP